MLSLETESRLGAELSDLQLRTFPEVCNTMRSRGVHVLLYWSNFIDLFQVDQVLKLKHNFSEIDFKAIKSLTLGKVTGMFY